MKRAPTLADAAIRASLQRGKIGALAIPPRIGKSIAEARKFMLDAEASAFMADLSHAAFIEAGDRAPEALEQCRHLARLPHALTWIEYDGIAFRRRTTDKYSANVGLVDAVMDPVANQIVLTRTTEAAAPEDTTPKVGWLLEQASETMFLMNIVVGGYNDGNPPLLLPHAIAWSTDGTCPPIGHTLTKEGGLTDARLATGMAGYDAPQVVMGLVPEHANMGEKAVMAAVTDFMGEIRYCWALLATLNDCPIGVRKVTPAKGYFARGKYHTFVEHSVISILIPKQRDPAMIARKVVAISRRRAHQVRGHWRRDWRHEGNRIWIKEHQRGDASLGFVTHDYAVEHKDEPT